MTNTRLWPATLELVPIYHVTDWSGGPVVQSPYLHSRNLVQTDTMQQNVSLMCSNKYYILLFQDVTRSKTVGRGAKVITARITASNDTKRLGPSVIGGQTLAPPMPSVVVERHQPVVKVYVIFTHSTTVIVTYICMRMYVSPSEPEARWPNCWSTSLARLKGQFTTLRTYIFVGVSCDIDLLICAEVTPQSENAFVSLCLVKFEKTDACIKIPSKASVR